ncbi:LuxR C-terminal-related transcriptional regulator [Legionella dresdenensis]|uniref:LuxR C-terminal-related transcriptional regulator n=1 Tax=Legionella dresdenensis TaxID=450200 RepID=A0ABV8CDZ4_9GAMM
MRLNNLLESGDLDIDGLISNISGYLIIKDLNSMFVSANNNIIEECKLASADEFYGLNDITIPHPLANISDFFLKLDKELIQDGNKIQGVYAFPFHQEIEPFIFNRFFIKNQRGEKVAIYSHCIESKDKSLIAAIERLKALEPITHWQNTANCYMFNKTYPGINLTDIQASCLFYLLRQKSYTEMARLLNQPLKHIYQYCDIIYAQLNVFTSNQLIELAIEKDYFSIVPRSIVYYLESSFGQEGDDYPLKKNSIADKVSFSRREMDCIHLLLKGKRIKEIAYDLNLSPRTVETYINQLKEKLGCRDRINLTLKLQTLFNSLD